MLTKLPLIFKHLIQIDYWFNRLNIFDGTNDMSMHIGEVHGNSNNKLTKSISSSGKALFIDFKKQYNIGTVEVFAAIKYKKMKSDCQSWVDLENNILMTPADLNTFNNSINCNWLITMNFRSYITLNFKFIEVIFPLNCYLFEKVTIQLLNNY